MARKKDLCRDSRGLFVRNLGWKKTARGYSQQKFYLGRDETQARIASLQLEQLWESVCRRWARFRPESLHREDDGTQWVEKVGEDAQGSSGHAEGASQAVVSVGVGQTTLVREGKPVWDDVSLAIAAAIRKGEAVAQVPLPDELGERGITSPSVGHWLDQLRRDVGVVHIELREEDRRAEAEAQIREEGTRLIDRGRRMMRRRSGGATLHSALDAYVKALAEKCVEVDGQVTPNGTSQIRQTKFIRRHLPNCELSELTVHKIDSLQEVIRLRPMTKRGNRSSVRSTKNYLKQFRAFIRWLSRAPDFDWVQPPDLDFGPISIPETAEEKSAAVRSARVQTYRTEELRVLWEYASPLQRILMLLALNCGFGAKEVASLELEDVHLRQKHPHEREVGCHSTDADSWICRLRNKTSVYGEWKLWPETVAAIDWWLGERGQIDVSPEITTLLVNQKGKRYDEPTKSNDRNPQVPNRWNALTTKIRKEEEYKDFRKLSFGKLRKTAGNLIRAEANGEVAGIFLCHGTPVKSDELLDVYTNRPFVKVFEAIERVGERLRPLWSSVEDPFPERRKKGGDNISRATIRRIESMRRQGYKVAYIMEKLGVSRSTVYRRRVLAGKN